MSAPLTIGILGLSPYICSHETDSDCPSIPYSIGPSIALQGAFAEHFQTIQSLSSKSLTKTESPLPRLNPRLVRTKEDLDACDALIIPGGESTTMAIVAKNMGLLDPLREFVKVRGKPTWGTCAGAILLSEGGIEGSKKGGQEVIGGIDVRIGRNGFGSQVIQIMKIVVAFAHGLTTLVG
jgi:pyridoxal 5'-phosphate synthase glutaminase subunit Pdx2